MAPNVLLESSLRVITGLYSDVRPNLDPELCAMVRATPHAAFDMLSVSTQ